MIADIDIAEKSFGDKVLMHHVKFSVDDGEKIGIVGRNGIGKSTLFGILAGRDKDFTGEVIFRRGVIVASTAQEHHGLGNITVMSYVLNGLPEYSDLKQIIDTYPEKMGDNLRLINDYTEALARFDDKGFYQIEADIERELTEFGLENFGDRTMHSLSGGQKRLIEIVKIIHADAHLALIDEPTNHMDYVAKRQFIDWMKSQPKQAMLVITHDRDVLEQVDRIIELKDGECMSYRGNYDAYLKQNAQTTASGMMNYEQIEKRMTNLKQKIIDYQRLKEKARNPGTIQKFKRLEQESRAELAELSEAEKPTFWIDKGSIEQLDYKASARYDKFKAKNVRISLRNDESRSKHVLVRAENLALGYGDNLLFEGVNIDLREGEAVELRGRNGAGKTTLIKALLNGYTVEYAQPASSIPLRGGCESDSKELSAERSQEVPDGTSKKSVLGEDGMMRMTGERQKSEQSITLFDGELTLDPHVRIGVYYQEIDERFLEDNLELAIEKLYLNRNLPISDTKIRKLCADYLFTDADRQTPLARLSGGQKARFQLIALLANDPQLLILDEPTNHLDLPSIEEMESALLKYSGAVLYVSHDDYFRRSIGGEVVQIGVE